MIMLRTMRLVIIKFDVILKVKDCFEIGFLKRSPFTVYIINVVITFNENREKLICDSNPSNYNNL